MSTLTVPIDDELYDRLQAMSRVRWSRVAQDGIRKRKILEAYMRNKTISEKDVEFCESIDWHPVDELPIKQEFIDRVRKAENEVAKPVTDLSDIFR